MSRKQYGRDGLHNLSVSGQTPFLYLQPTSYPPQRPVWKQQPLPDECQEPGNGLNGADDLSRLVTDLGGCDVRLAAGDDVGQGPERAWLAADVVVGKDNNVGGDDSHSSVDRRTVAGVALQPQQHRPMALGYLGDGWVRFDVDDERPDERILRAALEQASQLSGLVVRDYEKGDRFLGAIRHLSTAFRWGRWCFGRVGTTRWRSGK